MDKYQDIILLDHYESKYHKRMSIENRSSIFASFKALTGYEDTINESARFVEEKIILTDEEKELLNIKINNIKNNKVKITYFMKDNYKQGGFYLNVIDYIKKIDPINKIIVLNSKENIKIEDILDISML